MVIIIIYIYIRGYVICDDQGLQNLKFKLIDIYYMRSRKVITECEGVA